MPSAVPGFEPKRPVTAPAIAVHIRKEPAELISNQNHAPWPDREQGRKARNGWVGRIEARKNEISGIDSIDGHWRSFSYRIRSKGSAPLVFPPLRRLLGFLTPGFMSEARRGNSR